VLILACSVPWEVREDEKYRRCFILIFIYSGIRVSMYNAVTEDQIKKLVEYIKEFFGQA